MQKYQKFSVVTQSPRPCIEIIDNETKLSFKIDSAGKSVLQSYSYTLSTDNVNGNFSITLYPDSALFDRLKPFQVVKIYEDKNDNKSPSFVGIIHKKRFVSQSGQGIKRRVVISGTSSAALVADMKINLSFRASAITKSYVDAEQLNLKLTNQTNKNKTLSDVINTVWDFAVGCSKEYVKLSSVKILEYIQTLLGSSEEFFDCQNIEIKYPISNILSGGDTNSFWDIISNVIPEPPYEKFAYMAENGKMKIKIRELPFDSDVWNKLDTIAIKSHLLKDVEIEQSDSEVYTAFFAYLQGAAVTQDFALVLAGQKAGGAPQFHYSTQKFSKYGYRPLEVCFYGYGQKEDNQKDNSGKDTDVMAAMSERLQKWYENIDTMYQGQITLATDLSEKVENRCFVGKKIGLLRGEFYVTSETHSWNYGGNPETKLTITRGGLYQNGQYAELKNVTDKLSEIIVTKGENE